MSKKNKWKDYFYMILGTTILAAAINMFYDANQLVVGGITGLGIVIAAYSKEWIGYEIPLAVSNVVINAPLMILAWKIMGKGFLGRTVFATLYLSVALAYTALIPEYHGDILLAAVFGGVMAGVGLGLVFRGLATTGGTDLIAAMLHKFNRHIAVSTFVFVLDAAIIALGFFIFGPEKAMYAVISVYIATKCMGTIMDGMSFAKVAFIISDYPEQVSKALFASVERGMTSLSGKGVYTNTEKRVLLCAFSHKEIAQVKEAVVSADPDAFMIVTDANEVLGSGFQPMN